MMEAATGAVRAPAYRAVVRRRTASFRGAARFGKVEAMSVSHSYQTVTLARGKHASPRTGACVMELASMLAGEDFTDRPASVCPVIAAFLRAYNDAIDDRRRQDLYRYASAAVGTRALDRGDRGRGRERCVEELRALRRWPLGPFTAPPRTPPESVPGMERLAGRLARELHRSGVGGHTRALASPTSSSRSAPRPATRRAGRSADPRESRAAAAAR